MIEAPPTCKDCRFFGVRMNGRPHICVRPVGRTFSPVYGETITRLGRTCASERASERTLILRRPKCGTAGAFFVEHGPPPPPCSGWR